MSDDWSVPSSDDEIDPMYMPSPETIIKLYDRLNKGELLDLVTAIVPRKQLIKVEVKEPENVAVITEDDKLQEKTEEESEPNEFDFDSQAADPIKKFVPKRTPSRLQTKKVARMDKVCSNIIKYQKMDEAQLELEKSNK